MGVASLTITPSVPLVKILPSISMILCYAALEVLVLKEEFLLSRDTTIISSKKIATCSLWTAHAFESTGKEGFIVLNGMIDLDYQVEIELL